VKTGIIYIVTETEVRFVVIVALHSCHFLLVVSYKIWT